MIVVNYINKDYLDLLECCRERKLTVDEFERFCMQVRCETTESAVRISAKIRQEDGRAWIVETDD